MAPPPVSSDVADRQEHGPKVTKRTRWATRKLTVKSSSLKRLSLVGKKHGRTGSSAEKKRQSGGSGALASGKIDDGQQQQQDDAESVKTEQDGPGPRTLFFNLPLPQWLQDENGHPAQIYTRNKIRTAKYTPLSFIPKNLWFQFHNIANIFFLFVVILGIFSIFGVNDPGLNAAPLIFIVVVSSIKDAIEDYRRTILDNELNNAPVHRMVGWNNVNVLADNVSAWRKFKKANTKFFGALWHAIQAIWKKPDPKQPAELPDDIPRLSTDTTATRRESAIISAHDQRQSYIGGATTENIQMTPVPSPLPRDQPGHLQFKEPERPHTAYSFQDGSEDALRDLKGDLVNPDVRATGKARFHKDYWKSLVVGDFVRIYNDDQLPADIIILATSDPDGACYVETKNLDGETNLKVRSALRCGHKMKHAKDCERAQFFIESEAPQPNLYKYNGAIKWEQKAHGQMRSMTEPVNIDNMLLRGCNLRNTEWALGVVVFTGSDTKIMQNAGVTPSKRPRIARELNYNVIWNFGILFLMCLIGAIANGVAWSKTDASLSWFGYGSIGGTGPLTGFVTFWASMLVFQNLVPISLYISLEIVRTLQAFFIFSDEGMYYEKLDQPCIPKSWNISDDMGQIEYVFSDKTGTLTQNVMEFKKATINGQPYGEAYTEAQMGMSKRMGMDVTQEADQIRAEIEEARLKALAGLREMHDNPYLHDEDLTFIAPDCVEDLAGKHGDEQKAAVENFMLALALCHTVIAEKVPGDPPKMLFKAQSPDEAALVATARDMGFTVLGATGDGIRLSVMGKEIHYPVLNTIEFNSTRKRMSAIVKMPDGKIRLFCKGADSIIYSRLKRGEQSELRQETAKHLEMFAVEGLRTLCIADKVLEEDEYYEWRKEHDLAAAALEGREEKLEEAADKIERDLNLLGGTAIEDRLQDGVPDTIALLGEAGIKLWVLTGDKVETAINIGFSCNLLNNDMDLLRLQVNEDESDSISEDEYIAMAEQELSKGLTKFNITGSDAELKQARKDHGAPAATHALVIDGFTLRWVLSDSLRQKFLLLCKQCKSVLCCRVSPAQKAAVVSMVKNGLDVMTLSIGDGANDVAMIQEADVGVGIAGEEGRQAVMSSDYAIAQFRFLQRLILIHGRWSYRRLAETICNFFYKNMVWVWSIFWYQIFANFDISYIFDPTYIVMFNLLFTSVPVIFMGVLDQDVSAETSLAVPQLYRRGIERREWTQTKFWLHMGDGIYQSIISFFIPYMVVSFTSSAAGSGLDVSDRLRLGVYVGAPAVISINLYILLNCYRWDWIMLLVVFLSDAFVFFWTGVYTAGTWAQFFYGSAAQCYSQLSFWMVLLVTPCACMAPRFAVKCFQKTFFPYDVDVIREQQKGAKAEKEKKQVVAVEANAGASTSSSEGSARKSKHAQYASVDEDRRPIYPPSVATHNARSQNGSDGTNYTMHSRPSLEVQPTSALDGQLEPPQMRPSIDRARPSYDRVRRSLDMSRVRASYEASNDFTSAARLSRVESQHSEAQTGQRRFNLTTVRKRGLSAFSKKSIDY